MKLRLVYIPLVFLLASCVSKGKYNALKDRSDKTQSAKADVEAMLGKVSAENDSLKRKILLLDSLLITERLKNGMESSPAPAPEAAKAKSTVSKTVEYDTKALYINNIPNYVYWPNTVKTDKFLIGIVGDSKLNAALGAQLYGKNIHHLPALVEPYAPAEGKFYHMIFIAESKQNEFYKLKKELQSQPVLLIVENQALERAGAHVYVYLDGDKVKFRVNKKQIEKTGLSVSETLVKLGQNTQ